MSIWACKFTSGGHKRTDATDGSRRLPLTMNGELPDVDKRVLICRNLIQSVELDHCVQHKGQRRPHDRRRKLAVPNEREVDPFECNVDKRIRRHDR